MFPSRDINRTIAMKKSFIYIGAVLGAFVALVCVSPHVLALAATGTLDSQTIDTGVTGGAQLNSIMWGGSAPMGTSVTFQIAVSSSTSGPWNFIGPSGTSGTTYPSTEGVPVSLNNFSLLTGRYFRYRVILTTNAAQTLSPGVNSIIVNWSP